MTNPTWTRVKSYTFAESNSKPNMNENSQGGVTLCNFLRNLSRNAAATQVAEELHGVTCYFCNLSRDIFAARNVARSRTQFYFLQRLQQLSIAIAQCNTPPATCLAMLCSISQSGSVFSSPQSSSFAGLRVAGSVTPLFVQLQCYTFKSCKTSCTKYCPV